MQMKKITGMLMGVSLVALSACTEETGGTYFREAGIQIDNGSFGDATLNNALVQTGAEGFMLDLAKRFSEQVPDTVNFEFDQAILDEDARQTLRQQADWIRQFPEVRFRVYGHTDLVGSPAYNKRLGMKRAQTVVSYLVSQGISRSRLEAVVSFGETQPIIATTERERRNRRTVTEVSGFVKNHPTVLDGKYAQIVYREYVASATSPTTLVATSDSSLGE